jgi:hypothetical protein
MTIPYKLIPVSRPGATDKQKIFVRPSVVIQATVTPDMFLDKYSQKIKFSKADILYFMYSLQEFLVNELKEGNIVQTGAIGTFYPLVSQTVKGRGKHADYSNSNLKAGLNYRPDAEMMKKLKTADVKKART